MQDRNRKGNSISVINAEIIKKNANINEKKLNSLKHCVRSQITRLKQQKSFCD